MLSFLAFFLQLPTRGIYLAFLADVGIFFASLCFAGIAVPIAAPLGLLLAIFTFLLSSSITVAVMVFISAYCDDDIF